MENPSFENKNLIQKPFLLGILLKYWLFQREFWKKKLLTVKSRFPCFYTPSSSNAVAAYFDLANSHKIYLVMLWVPMIIFCTSCFFCVLCSYLVIVDKKGKTRIVLSVDPQI